MIHSMLGILVLLFPISEVVLGVSRHARGPAQAPANDRGSLRLLWIVIVVSVALAAAFSEYDPTRIRAARHMVESIALLVFLCGIVLRWTSVMVLGKYFTVNVIVRTDHRVIDTGPYRYVRHPSYSGLLLAFLGLGLYFNNWLSVAFILVPVTLALLYRIRVEEAALSANIGPAYAAYCARTKRLLPGVF